MVTRVVFAQTSLEVSTKLSVDANVVQTIELITVNSMQIGDLQPGQQEIYISPVQSGLAGFMIAVGTPGAEFQLNYFNERELTRIEGEGSIKFTYEISGNSSDDQVNSELLQNDNRSIRFNIEGEYFFWVGGRVDLTNAVPGSYIGDFTIEIDYI